MTEQEDLLLNATYGSRLFALDNLELANSCVETTRLLIAVLGKLDVTNIRPQAVHVRVFNKSAYEAMLDGLPYEEWPVGAHAMGTDAPREVQSTDPNGWAGHLVAVVRDEQGRRLIDASADQFHRPGSLNIPGPVGTRITGLWTPMDPQYRMLIDNQTIVEYRPIAGTEAKIWQTFPAWVADPEWFEEAAEGIAQRIKDGWTYTQGGTAS